VLLLLLLLLLLLQLALRPGVEFDTIVGNVGQPDPAVSLSRRQLVSVGIIAVRRRRRAGGAAVVVVEVVVAATRVNFVTPAMNARRLVTQHLLVVTGRLNGCQGIGKSGLPGIRLTSRDASGKRLHVVGGTLVVPTLPAAVVMTVGATRAAVTVVMLSRG
jgi:hypothetical protein